jgi:GntR family transcriptional regulator
MAGKSKYYEIKEQIEAKILQGEFPPGSQLPSEPELTEFFNTSRGTIRQALSVLADEGIIARRSGIGTIVVRTPPKTKRPQIMSFSKLIEAMGGVPRTKVLLKEKIMAEKAGGRVCEAFFPDSEEEKDPEVYCIKRLRYDGQQPLALQTIYLLTRDFKPDLLEKEDFTQSAFDLYARYHRQVAWADEIIRARPAKPEEIELFGMDELPEQQRFVYVRDRISYDQENMPLEVSTSIDRGDAFQAYQYRIVEDKQNIRPHDAPAMGEHRLEAGDEDP